jgi:lipopolysaccharide export system protein LptC
MQVTSDKKITIEGTQYNATGIGLKADLNLRQFELIKDIQATYETITP